MSRLECLNEIATKTAAMRLAQKLYFRTRSHDALESSKKLEREVDGLLSRLERNDLDEQLELEL